MLLAEPRGDALTHYWRSRRRGGDNPRTHGAIRAAAGRAACGGRRDAMELPSLRGFYSPGKSLEGRTESPPAC